VQFWPSSEAVTEAGLHIKLPLCKRLDASRSASYLGWGSEPDSGPGAGVHLGGHTGAGASSESLQQQSEDSTVDRGDTVRDFDLWRCTELCTEEEEEKREIHGWPARRGVHPDELPPLGRNPGSDPHPR